MASTQLNLTEDPNFERSDDLWLDLLKLKFEIKKYKKLLKSTGNKYLLEFDRGAEKKSSFWGGLIKNEVLYGENMMGKYLMKIRDFISQS